MDPAEIVVGPLEIYLGATDEAVPEISEDLAASADWTLLGKEGNDSITEDGQQFTHGQTVTPIYSVGSTGAVKAVREQETLMIAFDLMDFRLETYFLALNGDPDNPSGRITDRCSGSDPQHDTRLQRAGCDSWYRRSVDVAGCAW